MSRWLTLIYRHFNDLSAPKQVVDENRMRRWLAYAPAAAGQLRAGDVLATLHAAGVPRALTDDNYAVMKVARIGCECGANAQHFPASSYSGQRVLVQWSAMLTLSPYSRHALLRR
ncbi:hypothetical protein ACVXHB_09345 [Escherichia coli]